MGIVYHNTDILPLGHALTNGTANVSSNGGAMSSSDTVRFGLLNDIPFVAGSGAGASVVTVISGLDLPSSYSVSVTLSVPGSVSVSAKTNAGFTVTLTPTVSTLTLAAGTMDVCVFA